MAVASPEGTDKEQSASMTSDHQDGSPGADPDVGALSEFVEENDVPGNAEAGPVFVESKFTVERWREIARSGLAALLFLLLSATVLTICIRAIILATTVKELSDLLGILLAPLVGLVGAATGFYYGNQGR
ncbi:hypothetical protein WHI96_27435 [Pseudonocardia tropica]|uniref:Uncharacterized protein n=1 Tax=Pseudonocardia tropica TaxID=681289 RepID=A0ABV1K2U8_9PSEU